MVQCPAFARYLSPRCLSAGTLCPSVEFAFLTTDLPTGLSYGATITGLSLCSFFKCRVIKRWFDRKVDSAFSAVAAADHDRAENVRVLVSLRILTPLFPGGAVVYTAFLQHTSASSS